MLRTSVSEGLALLLILLVGDAHAVILLHLHDEFDDPDTLKRVREKEEVKCLGSRMDAVTNRLSSFKERDLEALFGKPAGTPGKKFAMPIAQPRSLRFSGIGHPGSKRHVEFYEAGDNAGIEVYYRHDGVSPGAVLLYLRVDKDFPNRTG